MKEYTLALLLVDVAVLLRFWLFCACVCLPFVSMANTLVLSERLTHVSASHQVRFTVTPLSLEHPQHFVDSRLDHHWREASGDVVNLLYQHDAVWVRIAVDARGMVSDRWLLEIGWPFLDRVEAWWVPQGVAPGDAHFLGLSGDHVPVTERLLQHRHPILSLAPVAGEQGEIWLRIVSTSSIMLSFAFWDTTAYLQYELRVQAVLGALMGIMLIMALYNLVIWFFVREPAYGYYVIYTFMVTLYVATLTGMGYQNLWGGSAWWSDNLLVLSAVLSFLFGGYFVLHFLDLAKRNPVACRLLRIMILLYWAFLGFALLLPEWLIAWPGQVVGIVVSVGAFVIGVVEWRKGNAAARHFTVAWFILLLGTCIYTLMLSGWLPQNLFTETVQIIGVVAEVVLLSFALGDRVNRERQSARQATEMSLHLAHELNKAHEEQIRTQLESNVFLEQQVDERTRDLQRVLADLEEANQQLAALSVTDPLTGLFNRRYFDTHVDEELRRCARGRLPIAVVVLDIDHFKGVNDNYGHLFGDECLCKVAQVMLRHTQRPGDVAVRFGGEEFVVLLSATDQQGALQVAESIRRDVSRIVLQHEGKKIMLTISIGVVVKVPDVGDTVTALLELADMALYQAKENGRNRVEVA